jgi:hypothetical protein
MPKKNRKKTKWMKPSDLIKSPKGDFINKNSKEYAEYVQNGYVLDGDELVLAEVKALRDMVADRDREINRLNNTIKTLRAVPLLYEKLKHYMVKKDKSLKQLCGRTKKSYEFYNEKWSIIKEERMVLCHPKMYKNTGEEIKNDHEFFITLKKMYC